MKQSFPSKHFEGPTWVFVSIIATKTRTFRNYGKISFLSNI